jgi:flagellar basal body-associated protein FliL
MLTPEEKQGIEDEERKRIAEEQYRAEIRAKLQQVAPPPEAQAGSPPPPKRSPHLAIALAVVLVLLMLAVIVVLSSRSKPSDMAGAQRPPEADTKGGRVACPAGTVAQSDGTCAPADSSPSTPPAPSVRYVPVAQQIASGQVVVPARGYVQYRIEIPSEALDARVSGSFNASGGRGNDVDAALANESEFANWINGHQARVLYGTAGKKTTDTFDVRLEPGTYIFAISNRFAMVSAKYVFLDVKLNYQRAETY